MLMMTFIVGAKMEIAWLLEHQWQILGIAFRQKIKYPSLGKKITSNSHFHCLIKKYREKYSVEC